jgi:Flp pilus assembly pilin Flp
MLSAYVFWQTLRMRLADQWESGQGLAEYSLMLVLIALLAIAALTTLGQTIISKLYQQTADL